MLRKLSFLILIFSSLNFAFADDIQDLTKSIRSVCAAPDQKGKYWNVEASGDAKVKIKFIGSHAGLKGEISAGEWEGVQKVLKTQQANENSNYRECVKLLFPIFVNNLTNNEKPKSPVLIKGNDFSLDLSSYEEGDLANELGKEIVILRKNNKNVVAGLQKKPTGTLEITGLKLENKFRLEIVNDMNSDLIEFIIRTRDDDIDNDIRIKIDGSYVLYGDKKENISSSAIGYNKGEAINDFVIYKKKDVAKFYINDNYFASVKSDKNVIYDKVIIKSLSPKDYIYDISGYNIKK